MASVGLTRLARGLLTQKRSILTAAEKYKEAHNVQDVRIKVPWGHVAVKTWGDEKLPLVLCVHGFMDNAASYDTLIPLLPKTHCYAAIDFPGLGLSSHVQPGFIYTDPFYAETMNRVRKHFGAQRTGIMGHSMGAAISIFYNHLYKNRTDFIIILDFLGYPYNPMEPRLMHLGRRIDKLISQEGKWEKEPTIPSRKMLLNGMLKAWGGNLGIREAELLLNRSVMDVDGQLKLRRDVKVQNNQVFGSSNDVKYDPAPDTKVCVVEASHGFRFSSKKMRQWNMTTFMNNHSLVERHMLRGNHHIHLNQPNLVAEIISNFLKK